MNDQSPFLVAPYTALAPVYDQAGFADYTRGVVLSYVNQAQALDWAGRRILDLGCRTGVSSWMLSSRGFRVTGVDTSPALLAQAQAKEQEGDDDLLIAQEPPQFAQQDIRTLESPVGAVDMVLAVDGVLNTLTSLRELEQAFARVAAALEPERLFVFDMWTIRGLATVQGTQDFVLYDNDDDLFVIVQHMFSYESLSNTARYTIFRRDDDGWQRADEIHVARGFPVQGVTTLLARAGLETLSVLDPAMQPFDAQADPYGRAVFVARRQPA